MAIAFDSFVDGGAATGSLTFAFNNVAGDIVFVGIMTADTNAVTGVTYAGNAMTQVSTEQNVDTNLNCRLYVLENAPTGSNNVIISSTGTIFMGTVGKAVSYSGASLTGQPDSSNANTVTSTTSLTISTTVVASNCWLVMWDVNANAALIAGTGTTQRGGETSGRKFFDSNGTVGTGSQSLQCTWTGSFNAGGIIASIKPPATTQILKVSGVAQASISKVSGVANASIAKVSGVANT